MCTFARKARVLGLATAYTGTGWLSQLHEHRCSKVKSGGLAYQPATPLRPPGGYGTIVAFTFLPNSLTWPIVDNDNVNLPWAFCWQYYTNGVNMSVISHVLALAACSFSSDFENCVQNHSSVISIPFGELFFSLIDLDRAVMYTLLLCISIMESTLG